MKKLIALVVLGLLLLSFTGCKEREPERYELVAIRNSVTNSASGGFLLFIGAFSLKQNIYYYAYIKRKDGAIKFIDISPECVVIYEDVAADEDAYAISDDYNPWVCHTYSDWAFHVPPGSVSREINLSLSGLK